MSRMRVIASLLTVPAVCAATLAAAPSPAHAVAASPDPVPASSGAAWLSGQLTHGLIHNDQYDFDDYGLSIDTGLALDAVGGYASTVSTIATAVADQVGSYVGDGTTESYAGALAKAAVFARAAGDDPTSFGGVDLITRLEARVQTSGAVAGRVEDASAYGDYANVIGQVFAVRALDDAGSSKAASATTFLLEQQCANGYFRQDFSAASATNQTCDGDTSAPSNDTTALAIIELQPEASTDPAVAAALTKAITYLEGVQGSDGSFGDGSSAGTANANSTGLAGWALGDEGEQGRARSAAIWVRSHQADDSQACGSKLVGDDGAIAYDDTTLAQGRAGGIGTNQEDQFRRATAQALPALQWAPRAGSHASYVGSTNRYLKAGAKDGIYTYAQTPGSTLCFTGTADGREREVAVSPVGFAEAPKGTRLAKRTGVQVAIIRGSRVLKAWTTLGPTKLKVTAPRHVARGAKPLVTVAHGLYPRERVQVLYRHKVVFHGLAGKHGRFRHRVKVGRKTGRGPLVVRGQFATRAGGVSLTVTRH